MSQVIEDFSDALAGLVKEAAPYLVRVEGRRRGGATGVALPGGLIVTAQHVLRQDKDITLGLDNGEVVSAELIGRDPTTDLALLRSSAEIAPLAISSAENRVGHLVLALGRPGKSVQATLGILSALGESWRTPMGGLVDQYIQTDVVMYPGFSGGPLINVAGQMIGLNTSGLLRGVSLTIPASTVVRVADALVKHGHVRRGYLGLSTQPVGLPRALGHQLQQRAGLLIVNVETDSPGDAAGLVLGDTIVAVANQPVQNHEDLLTLLSGDRIGQKTPLSIIRGGQLQSVDVVVGERPQA